MNVFEEGTTLFFEQKEYLIMKKILWKEREYLILAGRSEDFQLIVCQIIHSTNTLERVLDEEIVREVLFQMSV